MAAAEILQHEEGKKKRDAKSQTTITCTGRMTGEEEDRIYNKSLLK